MFFIDALSSMFSKEMLVAVCVGEFVVLVVGWLLAISEFRSRKKVSKYYAETVDIKSESEERISQLSDQLFMFTKKYNELKTLALFMINNPNCVIDGDNSETLAYIKKFPGAVGYKDVDTLYEYMPHHYKLKSVTRCTKCRDNSKDCIPVGGSICIDFEDE